MAKKPKSFDEILNSYIQTKTAKKVKKPSTRKPAKLPDGSIGEQYAFIKFEMPCDPNYDRGEYNEQERLEKLLDEFVLNYKPKSYRIINAQIVYLSEAEISSTPAGVLHVVHIGYVVE